MSENKGITFRQLLPPYEKYKSSGPRLHKAENRMVIDCMDITHGSQHLIGVLYARYLYEVTHKCTIPPGYEIDHIDGDKTNDSIENLQAVPAYINTIKGTRLSTLINKHCKTHVLVRCPICGSWFETTRIKYNQASASGKILFCRKDCYWKSREVNAKLTQPCIEYKEVPEQPFKHIHPDFTNYSTPFASTHVIHRCKDCGKAIPAKNKLCGDCEKARRFPQETKDKTLKVIEQSFQQYNRLNMVFCGKLLNISDKAVSKRCKRLFGTDYKTILTERFSHP